MRRPVALTLVVLLHAVAAAGDHVLEGVVRDVDGRPVPDATVRLGDAYAESRSRTVVADGEGRYRIEALDEGVAEIRAGPAGQPPLLRAVRLRVGTVTRFDPVVLPGHVVRGRVAAAETGAPLVGARVVVRGDGYWGAFHGMAVTSDDGRYELTTPARGHRLHARALLDGWRLVDDDVSVAPDGDGDIELDLVLEPRPAGTVRGLVRDDTGAPLADVEVMATNVRRSAERSRATTELRGADPGYWSTRTAADGSYALEHVDAGTVTVIARAAGRYQDGDDGRFFAPGGSQELPGPLHVTVPDGGVVDAGIVLRPKLSVRGEVRDEYAIPVAGATVAVPANVAPLDRVETDDSGGFELPVAPGRGIRIFATAPEHEAAFVVLDEVSDEAPEHPVELTVRRFARITVQAATGDGGAVRRARAAVVPRGMPALAALGEVRHWTPLDDEGSGALSLRADVESVGVVVHAPGFAPHVGSDVLPSSSWQASLDRGHTVRGRVLDADGRPRAGVRITLEPHRSGWDGTAPDPFAFGRAVWAVSGAEGEFVLRDLAAGSHGIVASGPALWSAAAAITLPSDDEIVLRPEPALPISGVVVDDAGEPVAGVRVEVGDSQSREVHPFTDARGRFRLWWTTPGEHQLRADPPSDAWMTTGVEGVASGASDVRIVLARRHPLVGRVVTTSGAPLPGARVVLSLVHENGARRHAEILGDEDGAFTFGRLSPVAYVVSVLPDGGGWAPLHRRLVAAGQQLELRVAQGARIVGVLLDGDGRPAAGRTLTARLPSPPDGAPGWMRDERWSVNTGENGAFVFEGLSESEYRVSLVPSDRPEDDFLLAGGGEESVTAGSEDVTLRGAWGAGVEGLVVDGGGNGLPGVTARLRVGNGDRETVTGEDGRFRLANLPEEALRRVPSFVVEGWQVVAITPRRGTDGEPFRVTMLRAVTVVGSLVDADGEPLAGWRIEVRLDEHAWQRHVMVSSEGRFRVTAPEGVLICRARRPDGGEWEPCGRFSTNVEDVLLRLGDE